MNSVSKNLTASEAIWLSARGTALRIGLAPWQIVRIAYYGGVPVRRGGRAWQIGLDPQWRTGTDLYEAYLRGIIKWDHETSYAHKRIRIAAQVDADYPWPKSLDEFVIDAQGIKGIRRSELLVYYETEKTDLDRHQSRLLSGLLEEFENGRKITERRECDLDLVLRRFPELKLPDTCATDAEMDEPPLLWLGSAMSCRHVAGLACAAQIIVSEGNSRSAARIGRGFEVLDAKLQAMEVEGEIGAEEIRSALWGILEDAKQTTSKTRAKIEGVRAIVAVLRLISIYLSSHPGVADRIAPLASRRVHQNRELRRALVVFERKQLEKGRKNRKRDAEEVTDRFTEFSLSTWGRALEAKVCSEQIAEAMPLALAHFKRFDEGAEQEAYFEVYTAIPVFDEKGQPVLGARQLACWRLWREGDMWRSLSPEQDICPNWCGLNDGDRRKLAASALVYKSLQDCVRDHGSRTDIVAEFIDWLPDIGSRTSEPHFATPYRLGVITSATESPPQLQRERLTYFRENKMPQLPNSLRPFGYGKSGTALGRWSRQMGRCVIPIEDFAMGMRFAYCAVSIVRESLARRMEMLQIRQSHDCLRTDLGPTGKTPGFRSVPKRRASPEDFLLSEATFLDCLRLAKEIAASSGHEDGYLPDVQGDRCLPARLAGQGPYLFQWEGSALSAETLGFLIALLGAGFGRVTMHILRHAASNNLNQRGAHEAAVKELLRHQAKMTSDYYTAATSLQIADKQTQRDAVQRKLVRDANARRTRSRSRSK